MSPEDAHKQIQADCLGNMTNWCAVHITWSKLCPGIDNFEFTGTELGHLKLQGTKFPFKLSFL